MSTFVEHQDIERLLIGDMTSYIDAEGRLTRQVRMHDGLWTEKDGTPGQHVSGVLFGTELSPSGFLKQWPTLWLNARADLQLNVPLPSAARAPAGVGQIGHSESPCLALRRARDSE
jgi:hypothetical protein